MTHARVRVFVLIAAAVSSLACEPAIRQPDSPHPLNTVGVTALLDVMDAIATEHPDLQERTASIVALPDTEREAALGSVRAKNEASEAVMAAIDALLATETYQTYFRRFTNVTPGLFRELLLDLPYRRRDAPGGTGDLFYNLIRRRRDVRTAFARLLDEIDMQHVYRTAESWAPPVIGDPPVMHLIYDSNAGSFATEGKSFLNVYSGLGLESLLSEPIDGSMREVHGTMAHELHHVLARPTLYPATSKRRGWRAKRVDRLVRGLVGEGLAFHCYPPAGPLKSVYEDPVVIDALVRRFGEMLLALRDESTTEEEVETWYRDNYFEHAEALLREHLSRRYQGEALEREMRAQMSFRPDVEHALGWWMTSRVSGEGARREDAMRLLEDPYSVFRRYNQAVDAGHQDQRFAADVVAYVETLASR